MEKQKKKNMPNSARDFRIPFDFYIVWWQDAYVTLDEKPTLTGNHLTISIGIPLNSDDKEFLHLSGFYDGISNLPKDPFTSIPRSLIKHIVEVKCE